MSQSMHIVILKDTGHIVAAVAQTTAAGDPAIETLVGRDLPIWQTRATGNSKLAAQALLPVEVLVVKSVAFDSKVIANPLQHAVDGGRVERLPPSTVVLGDFNLDNAQITLENGAPDTFALAVVAVKSAPDEQRRVQSGKISNPTTDLVLPLSILPGEGPAEIETGVTYSVVVAFAGKRLAWFEFGL